MDQNLSRQAGFDALKSSLNNRFRLSRRGVGLWACLVMWQRRYSERQHLMDLDPRFLVDMGMSEEGARAEALTPFWLPHRARTEMDRAE